MCGNIPTSLVRRTTVTNQKNVMSSVQEWAVETAKSYYFNRTSVSTIIRL